MGIKTTPNNSIEPTRIDEPITLPLLPLHIKDLPILATIGRIDQGKITMQRGLRGTVLKTPVTVPVDSILELSSKGLAEYILESMLKSRPHLIPWVLANKSLINLATHLLRAGSGSQASLYGYCNDVHIYVRRFKLREESADRLILDVRRSVRGRVQVDSDRLDTAKESLARVLAEMQDRGLAPDRLKGFARHIRTFYRVNDIELPKPKTIPRGRVVNKDRAPTQQEMQTLLDLGDPRERVILSMLGLGGFREATLARLQYHHIKQDFENNKIPLHIHVDSDIVKGHYSEYDTFLGQEAFDYIRLDLKQRQNGTSPQHRNGRPIKYVPPEEIHDDTPLIRNTESAIPKPIGEKNIYRIIHRLYYKAGLLRKNKNGHYDLRVHSIRKFFKTQLIANGVSEPFVDYMMGHVTDVYTDVESKGVEFLRGIYAKAALSIRPRSLDKVEMTKEILERILGKLDEQEKKAVIQSFAEPHRTLGNQEARDDHEIGRLVNAIVDRLSHKAATTSQNPPAS